MNCKSCKREIADDSVYCQWCGKKQLSEHKPKSKRANGEGSVYKQKGRKSHPWIASITLNRKRIYVGSFATETEAKRAVIDAQVNGISDKNTYTLKKLYDEWSDVHFRELSTSGIQGYKTAWKYLQPIANYKVRDLRTTNFQMCIDLCAEKFSRDQCEKIKQLSSQLCKKAMEYDLLNKNYAQFLVLPKSQAKEKSIFTDEEIKILKKHDYDERAKIILTFIYTGFRPNELFSVTVDNVHLDKDYIVGGSKTEAGINRKVPIHPDIMPYIKEWYERAHGKKVIDISQPLITTQNGKKYDLKNFRSRQFYPLLIELGILQLPDGAESFSRENPPRLTPYSTRHTFASLASKSGMKAEILQEIMGHEDYATTVNYYEHFGINELQDEIKKFSV